MTNMIDVTEIENKNDKCDNILEKVTIVQILDK